MKKILHISLLVSLVAGTFILVSFADQKHRVQRYQKFTVEVLNPSDESLINEQEIRELVREEIGTVEGTMISMINTGMMESLVNGNPYVSACEVYQTINGELILKAMVRKPLVRIINEQGQQYFLDYSGYLVPVNYSHPSHILVASGNISDRLIRTDEREKSIDAYPDSSVLRQIYPVARVIAEDEFLTSFIDQVYVNERKELELVPKIGSQEIIFGTSENAKEKLENLKTFYTKVMSRLDWHTYKTINLKYNHQVVCSKH